MRKHTRHTNPRHAIARIDHYLEWLHLVHVNEREDMLDIGINDLVFPHLPGVNRCGKVSSDRQVANSIQTRVQANGKGLGTTELHAIILPWIVRCGNHHPGWIVECPYGKVQSIGCNHTQVYRVCALINDTTEQGSGQLR